MRWSRTASLTVGDNLGTTEFLDSVLPPSGLRCLAIFRSGLGSPPDHFFYDTNDELASAAAAYDKLKKNTYFATSAYLTDANRKGTNVAAVKSLYADLDVGPKKPYKTPQEAVAAYEKFRIELDLPECWIIKSGSGVHIYQPFAKPIAPDQWARLAAFYAACMDHYGVEHDTSRTQDVASILRIPGTNNYKTDPPKSVKALRAGVEVPAREIYEKLKAYVEASGLIVGTKPSKANAQRTNELIAPKDYPPSEGSVIAQHCPIIKHAADTGGDNEYEVWWRTIGVAKHTTDPEGTAEYWTRNRANTNHDKTDWQTVLVNWAAGPTTCAEFSKHSDKCATCPHNGKIKSPIQLGTPEEPAVNVITPATEEGPPAPPPMQAEWTFAAPWIQQEVCKRTRTGIDAKGRMTMNQQQEDGTYKQVVFCDRYWQVMRRLRLVDGSYHIEIGYQKYPGHPHETFTFPSAYVTSPDLLKKEFSARELHIYGGQKAMTIAQNILRENQALLIGFQRESVVVETMGWATVNNRPHGDLSGKFVAGQYAFQPKTPVAEVVLSNDISGSARDIMATSGSTAEWVDLVNFIYNRSGAELYQFLICAAFAAPLVRITPGSGTWHGIPISLWGGTGAAKTSTALAAMTVYGRPDTLLFSAQKGHGDTINALSQKMGALNNLPFIADEMTGQEAEHIRDVMYMLANGKAKDRSGQNGKLIHNPHRWDTISIITSNESLHERLRQLRSQHVADATSMRCFEIEITPEDMQRVFADVPPTLVSDNLCAKQYGCVGRDWIKFIVNNRLKVSDMLGKYRQNYKVSDDDRSDIRFYKDLLIVVEVAARLAQKLGFIRWDINKMMEAAKNNVLKLRAAVSDKDWESVAANFIASLHGRTIVTKKLHLGRGRRHTDNVEMSRVTLSTSLPPVARKAIEDKLFFVQASALHEWARENRYTPSTLTNSLEKLGLLVTQADGSQTRKVSIGNGTDVTVPRAACYQFDYDKITAAYNDSEAEAGPLEPAEPTNVVQFPGAVTESVTEVVTETPTEGSETAAST